MSSATNPIILLPGEGRIYPMGRITAVFKADGPETGRAYSVSEWWMEPNTKGPGAHSHDADHVWYVIEGTMSVLVGEAWLEAPPGTYVVIPGGVIHDFENRSTERAGILNINTPGGFEDDIPAIQKWFAENPPEAAHPTALSHSVHSAD